MAKKKRVRGKTLRGSKDVLAFLRHELAVQMSRMTLYRRRTRPNDPFPGTLLVIERRAVFVTTDVAARAWVRRNLTAPPTLFYDDA